MNILMIFRNNPLATSGAVSYDLFNEFRSKGHNVRLLVNYYKKDYPDGIISMETTYSYWKHKAINKIKRTFGLHEKGKFELRYHFHGFDDTKKFYSSKSILKRAGIKPDVIIVLFAKDFVNAKNMYELNRETGSPVFWMMYDTAPLTGGCHYSWDCTGYQDSCGNCPGIYSNDPHDITYRNLLFKKTYLDKTDIHLVLASEWQNLQAKQSSVFKNKPIHKILISINPEIFKIVPKEISRNKVGVSTEKKVIFFGAKSFNDKRKGSKYLLEALQLLKDMLKGEKELTDKVFLLIAGEETDRIKDQLPFEYKNMGMVNNTDGIASAYQAADVFVCPSIEDAGPSMVNQSVMCGTPVVSFAQGVSLDIVITGKTGYRVKMLDSHDMAKGIYEIIKLSEEEHMQMRNTCRQTAFELFHPDVTTEQWLKIIKAN